MSLYRPQHRLKYLLYFCSAGKTAGLGKISPREESTVIGPRSALSLTVTMGETQPWCETLFSCLDNEGVSLDVLSGPFQLGCQ